MKQLKKLWTKKLTKYGHKSEHNQLWAHKS